jgi:hypothetical protein
MVALGPLDDERRSAGAAPDPAHYELTRPARVRGCLSGWSDTVKQFVKVLPSSTRRCWREAHLDTDEARVAAV